MTSVSDPASTAASALSLEAVRLAETSVRMISAAQTPEGAYPAAHGFGAYAGYCWFRDGSFIADAMSAAGEGESAQRFFGWCAGIIATHADRIDQIVAAAAAGSPVPAEQMLPARFRFDGRVGDDEWWDFQLDGYGTWVWALAEHLGRHGLDASPWREPVTRTIRYLVSSWSRPCFDWWEEHDDRIHVSTLACIAAGLRSALDADLLDAAVRGEASRVLDEVGSLLEGLGNVHGHLVKWLGDDAVDGSLAAAIAPLGVIPADRPLAAGTIDAIERYLTVAGGTHRYLGDSFYGGGQWPLLSCFLGLAHLERGDADRARELLDWAVATAAPSGELPEQIDDHLIAPNLRAVWIDRWGPSARPLYWSHAMVVRLAVALTEVTA